MVGTTRVMRAALTAAILLGTASVTFAVRTPRGLLSATSAHAADLGSDDMFELFSKHADAFPFTPEMEGGAAVESGQCPFPKFESDEPSDMVDKANEKAKMGAILAGGYAQENSNGGAAIEVGTYAVLKLNCARAHAEPKPCLPLVSAKVLSAYSHVTATQFWYVNISVGQDRLVKATVAVNNELIAEDLDCPDLAMNSYSPLNLIKFEEYLDPKSDAAPVPVEDVCKFETESSEVGPSESSLGSASSTTSDASHDPLGMNKLRVEGVPWSRPDTVSHGPFNQQQIDEMNAKLGDVPPYEPDAFEVAPADFVPPKHFDLRDEYSFCKADRAGHQGQCGSCWAFGLVHMFSYRMCVQTRGRYNDIISAQQLVSCRWGGGCDGGWGFTGALEMGKGWNTPEAMPEWSEFPYTSSGGTNKEQCLSRNMDDINAGRVHSYAPKLSGLKASWWMDGKGIQYNSKYYLSHRTYDELIAWAMHQIMTEGPILAVMYANIFFHDERHKGPKDIYCDGGAGEMDSNHAMLLVGWGETDSGEKYWIAQNSWGADWMDEGRVKIHRGNNACRIEEHFIKVNADFDIMPDQSLPVPSCSNGGMIDWDTKTCVCPPPWVGAGVAGDLAGVGRNGCEICGIEKCENGAVLDEAACKCECKPGYGGPECQTSISADIADGTLHATLRLGPLATVNADIAVAVRVGETGKWKVVSQRGELCGEIVDGDPSPCVKVDEIRALQVEIDLGKNGIVEVGQEVFVKFVQGLGMSEFGTTRGYEMDKYGASLVASAGVYVAKSCSDVTVTVTAPEGQFGMLSWTVGQGDGVSASLEIELDGEAVSKDMSACLANEATHNLKVSGQLNPGSAFDRFSAAVKQKDYDDAVILTTGSVFAFPDGLLFETPMTDPKSSDKRILQGAAAFKVWPKKPLPPDCVPVKVTVGASAFGNGAAASMMEYDLLPSEQGEAETKLYAPPGSLSFGTERSDLACVSPGDYEFVAGVSGHAAGAGGWGFGTSWSVSTLAGDEIAGVPVDDSRSWFTSGNIKSSGTISVAPSSAASLGRVASRRRALLAAIDGDASPGGIFGGFASGAGALAAGAATVAVAVIAAVAATRPREKSTTSPLLANARDSSSFKYDAVASDDGDAAAKMASARASRETLGVVALVCALALAAAAALVRFSGTDQTAGSLGAAESPLARRYRTRAAEVGDSRLSRLGHDISFPQDVGDDDDAYESWDASDYDFASSSPASALGYGCGSGVKPCLVLQSPDCRSKRAYLYSPGVVAELHPNGKVLHPLDSVTKDPPTPQVVERVTCPGGVGEEEVCVTHHRAAVMDVSVYECRSACDHTKGCTGFTHRATTDAAARAKGFGDSCTLLSGVSGDGPVSRASAGSNVDDHEGKARGGLRGHATYFLQENSRAMSQDDAFKDLPINCEAPEAGANVADAETETCVEVDKNHEAFPVAALGGATHSSEDVLTWPYELNGGVPVTIDTITVMKPARGMKVVAGFPSRYVVCAEITHPNPHFSTSECSGVVATHVWLVKLRTGAEPNFQACGVRVTAAEHLAGIHTPLPKGFTLKDGSQPVVPKSERSGHIEEADEAFDPIPPPPSSPSSPPSPSPPPPPPSPPPSPPSPPPSPLSPPPVAVVKETQRIHARKTARRRRRRRNARKRPKKSKNKKRRSKKRGGKQKKSRAKSRTPRKPRGFL